jgi:hypothetical protein
MPRNTRIEFTLPGKDKRACQTCQMSSPIWEVERCAAFQIVRRVGGRLAARQPPIGIAIAAKTTIKRAAKSASPLVLRDGARPPSWEPNAIESSRSFG